MTEGATPLIFDRAVVKRHRDRAAIAGTAEFLFDHTAEDFALRLSEITRSFEHILVTGARRGQVARGLLDRDGPAPTVFQADLSHPMARAARSALPELPVLVMDEELLPFAIHSLDLILCPLTLHWLNDLPGALAQMQRALKPDGLLMASMLGGDTLTELRSIMLEAEAALLGGAGPRVNPAIDLRDAAGLMQRAGFALPVADTERLDVTYESALALLRDLRAMGETSAFLQRDRRTPPRGFWPLVTNLYEQRHAGPDGRITATFELFTLTGWHPHESQQKPLRPGSGQTDLAAHLSGMPKQPS